MRSCANARSAQWQRGGQGNQRRKRAKSARVVSGRRRHRLRMLVDLLLWTVGRIAPGTKSSEDTRSTTASSNRSSDAPKICEGARAPSGGRRRNRRCLCCLCERLLCQGSSASPWFTGSCCRDGSLAMIQPLWVQKTSKVPSMFEGVSTAHTCAHSTSNACTSLERHCNTAHPFQSSFFGSVHPRFAGNIHASVRASGIERERSCPTACATCPVFVGRDRSLRKLRCLPKLESAMGQSS